MNRTIPALAALLVGCGGASPEPQGTPASDSRPAPTAAATSAASSAATPAATASTAPATPSDTAKEPPAAPSPFRVVADFGKADVTMYSLGPAALLLNYKMDQSGAALLENGAITVSEKYSDGLPTWGNVVDVTGTWPKQAALSFVTGNGRVGWGESYVHDGRQWKHAKGLNQRWIFTGIAPWTGGRMLGLTFDSWGFEKRPPKFELVSGLPGVRLPKLARGSSADCLSKLGPATLATSPEGHVFVFGTGCSDGKPAVEWFGPGKTSGTYVSMPEFGGSFVSSRAPLIVKRGTGGYHIIPRPGTEMLTFDGKTLKAGEKVAAGIVDATTGGDTLWLATGDGAVQQIDADGKTKSLPMPSGVGVDALHADAEKRLWVLGNDGKLYGLQALAKPRSEPIDMGPGQTASKSFTVPKAARADCKKLYALFYAFTKVTPDDYDFPLTRKALKGQTQFSDVKLAITRDGGKKYLGGFPPDYATGKKLIARIKAKVKGSIPVLLCADPEIVRPFPLNYATGELEP